MPTALTGSRGLNETGSGLLTTYQGDNLVALGMPSLVGLIDSDNKAVTTGFASTLMYTTVASGVFEITSGLDVYAFGTGGTIQAQVVYWGDDSGTPRFINVGSAVSANSNVTTVAPQLGKSGGSVLIRASSGTGIYGSTTLATATGTPSYRFQMLCKRVL